MGNETYLITTTSPAKPAADAPGWGRSGEILLYAKNSIPAFWFLLFDAGDLIDAAGPAEAGGTVPYAAMSRSTADGLALARSRWPRVGAILGPGAGDLFDRWARFVERAAEAFIHCETWEWSWLFRTPRGFRSHLRRCLAAPDHVPRIRRGRPALNRWWREWLGQCQAIDRNDRIGGIGDFSYCGVPLDGRKIAWSRECYEP